MLYRESEDKGEKKIFINRAIKLLENNPEIRSKIILEKFLGNLY